MQDVTLYGYWRSSASWRARIALHLVELPFTYEAVHLVEDGGRQYSDAHTARNPMQQVPVLAWSDDDGTHRLTQSLAIIELLNERFGGLLPEHPVARARARQLAEMVNSGIQPFQNLWLVKEVSTRGADGRALAGHAIERGLVALEREIVLGDCTPGAAGTYLVGDQPSVADACLVPQLYNARRFGIDLAPFPRLREAEAAAQAHPAFRAAHPDAQPDAVSP